MTKDIKNNTYTFCRLRDKQFALYVMYAKSNKIMMKTLLTVNSLYYAKNGLTQKQICEHISQVKQTVSLIVNNLIKEGYVSAHESAKNKRNKIVKLTNKGRKWCQDTVLRITHAEETAMSMLSKKEQEQLISLSEKYTMNFESLINKEIKNVKKRNLSK